MNAKRSRNTVKDGIEARAGATVFIWITYLAMIWASMASLETWSILLAFVLMIPLTVAMIFMWGEHGENASQSKAEAGSEAETEKRKRDRIDAVLRLLSSDDLERLRERLSDGTIDDDALHDLVVGDDGELIQRKR
jgi:hypothetical protein